MVESKYEPAVLNYGQVGDQEAPLSLQSLCLNCQEQGDTRMLWTSIPHFRDVVVMSFICPHCGYRDTQLSQTTEVAEKGVKFVFDIKQNDHHALDRQIVKSEFASIQIPELDFEIPSIARRGDLNTVEGVLQQVNTQLGRGQESRREADPEGAAKVEEFRAKIVKAAEAEMAFTFIIDDPSGDSFIQAIDDPDSKSTITKTTYTRTPEQQRQLALVTGESTQAADPHPTLTGEEAAPGGPHHGEQARGALGARAAIAKAEGESAGMLDKYCPPEEVMVLPGSCAACGQACDTRMFQTEIPLFREVIIMSNACDACGYKNSEVRVAGAVSEMGKRLTLQVKTSADLNRDVIKSDAARLKIPELELEMDSGLMGGVVSTVQGLIRQMGDLLRSGQAGFALGDSAVPGSVRDKWVKLLDRMGVIARGEEPCTLVIEDPLSSSYIAEVEDGVDAGTLECVSYQRSEEEEEELGIAELKRAEAAAQSGEGGGEEQVQKAVEQLELAGVD